LARAILVLARALLASHRKSILGGGMPQRIAALLFCALPLLSCGTGVPETPVLGFAGLLTVREVRQIPLALTLGGDRMCQVSIDVLVDLPDCTGFGATTSSAEGNTFRYEVHGSPGAFCSGAAVTSFGLCIGPGLDQPGRLPAGDYVVVVNGVAGQFTWPEPAGLSH
jgi:hypothetical protein